MPLCVFVQADTSANLVAAVSSLQVGNEVSLLEKAITMDEVSKRLLCATRYKQVLNAASMDTLSCDRGHGKLSSVIRYRHRCVSLWHDHSYSHMGTVSIIFPRGGGRAYFLLESFHKHTLSMYVAK